MSRVNLRFFVTVRMSQRTLPDTAPRNTSVLKEEDPLPIRPETEQAASDLRSDSERDSPVPENLPTLLGMPANASLELKCL